MRTSSPSRLALILCAHQGCANTNEDKNAPPLWSRNKDFVHKNYPDPHIFNSQILFLIKRKTGTGWPYSASAFFYSKDWSLFLFRWRQPILEWALLGRAMQMGKLTFTNAWLFSIAQGTLSLSSSKVFFFLFIISLMVINGPLHGH
jgi:hypothetical protein